MMNMILTALLRIMSMIADYAATLMRNLFYRFVEDATALRMSCVDLVQPPTLSHGHRENVDERQVIQQYEKKLNRYIRF